jgi:hypothetical protein
MTSIKQTRTSRGATPAVQIPILLFVYTLIFLMTLEIIMLFWLQSSLNTAAKQIAVAAANNPMHPLSGNGVVLRCQDAVTKVGQVFPGYSAKVRADFVNAVVNGGKTKPLDSFDEIGQAGGLRSKLIQMGAERPQYFWGGSTQAGPGNLKYGGCYAFLNPITSQVAFHVVIHCKACWPVFLRGFFMDAKRTTNLNAKENKRVFSLSGWLEGRGSYIASQSGAKDELSLNKSLVSSAPRPIVVCNHNECDVKDGGDQNEVYEDAINSTEVCSAFKSPGTSRPTPNTIILGTHKSVFAIDQWSRGRMCTRCVFCPIGLHVPTQTSATFCNGADMQPSAIVRIANCGDLKTLFLIGLRYACAGVDGFGRVMNAGPPSDMNPIGSAFLGRCDHYFGIKPACAKTPVPMDKSVGDVTNLNGARGPCAILREDKPSSETIIVCRTDSGMVLPWLGPYSGGPATAVAEYTAAAMATTIQTAAITVQNLSTALLLPPKVIDGPLDMAIPYHAVCDICNPGSPRCGMYGTCRNQSSQWPTSGESKVVGHIEIWHSSSLYALNPIYTQIECKYRRDCQERHCCWDAPDLDAYCAARPIVGLDGKVSPGSNKRVGQCCDKGCNSWKYIGKPNRTPMNWTPYNLPRLGGFPHCSTGAVAVLGEMVGECCAPDVLSADIVCSPEPAIPVQLAPPPPCGVFRECQGGRMLTKFCPGKPPKMSGNCISTQYPYPIGVGSISGFGGSPGTLGPVPGFSTPTNTMCNTEPLLPSPNTPPPTCDHKEHVREATKVSQQDASRITELCRTVSKCLTTPLVISLNESSPTFSDKKVCFRLNPTVDSKVYRWLKGSPNQGFLAYDFNKNGKIDDGTELFGGLTMDRYYPSGYTALASIIDKNHDGLIKDKELMGLIYWSDVNEDGKSQKSEMKSLESLGIVELDAGLYLTGKESQKIFLKDGSALAYFYSPKGYKLKNGNYGNTWDIVFQGYDDKNCTKSTGDIRKFVKKPGDKKKK